MAILISSHTLAKHSAQAIVSDISLYHEEKIVNAIRNNSLFDELKEQIDEGRELYEGRVAKEIVNGANYFDRAIIDLIFKENGKEVDSSIW